jgi:hypothetical protein
LWANYRQTGSYGEDWKGRPTSVQPVLGFPEANVHSQDPQNLRHAALTIGQDLKRIASPFRGLSGQR